MRVYQCEDSQEGIFTAIYKIYEDKCSGMETVISLTGEYFLFGEHIAVETEPVLAEKVAGTLRRKFGEENYWMLCMALASRDIGKAQAVFRTVAAGLGNHCNPGHLLDNLADPHVHQTFALSRAAHREYQHLQGALRFVELEQGILYSPITPKNNILAFLMPHFADRLPGENFVICDRERQLFGIHPACESWYMVWGEAEGPSWRDLALSEGERQYQELFWHFCREISIKERKNLELQRNLLPLRFRENMIEFS